MGLHLTAFLGVSVLLIVTPGPDTALTTKNALLTRPRVKAGLDRFTGVVLIGLGLRLATERH